MIPVVDLMTYPNTYLQWTKIGRLNAWDYFFEQPYNTGVKEALKNGQEIIFSDGKKFDEMPNDSMECLYSMREKDQLHRI